MAVPAYGVVALVLIGAVYSFSHRPPPAFPPTQVHPDKLLVNGLAQSGKRLIAAGELGHILVSDSPDGPWRESKIEPSRGSTFTRAAFIDDKTALAVGHDGWIVRSSDGGETWKEVAFDPQRPDPLLNVAGPFDGKLYAMGAFGLLLTSSDQGQTWQPGTLAIEGEGASAAPSAEAPPAEADPNADPFANFSESAGGDSSADRHLNAMISTPDGSLLLVGERGVVLQSRDSGVSWKKLDTGYAGSFFGAIAAGERVLVYGMRGNAFWSADAGATWTRSKVPVKVSLFSGTALPSGDIVLVGDNNTVLQSKDGGATFTVASEAATRGLAAGLAEVLVLPDGSLLTAGDTGITRRAINGAGNGAAP
ncbi:MAG TPA: sialidase [Verrucomicrobiae bacterium]|nr:sialidase [Verrucomicrobiae bacterium]